MKQILIAFLVLSACGQETPRIDIKPDQSDNVGKVRFFETNANGSNYIDLAGPASIASNRTVTLQDASHTLAGIDIAQNWTASQAFQDINARVANTYSIGAANEFTLMRAKTFDGVTSATPGDNWMRTRKMEFWDAGGSTGFWYGEATANGAGTSQWRLRDQASATRVEFQTSLLGATSHVGTMYGDWYPDVTGRDLGTSGKEWDANLRNVVISGTCTGCGGGLPVSDSTSVVHGSSDASKLARFEVDGFTASTTRVFTLPNSNGTLAAIDVAQTWTASQALQDINSRVAGSYSIGGANEFSLMRATTFDGATSATPGANWIRTRKYEIWDAGGGGGFWYESASANGTNSQYILRDNGGNIRVTYDSVISGAGVQQGIMYGNWLPDGNFTRTIGNGNLRWDQYWGRTVLLRTNASALALITARDSSNNLTFSMGDGGGSGGEFNFYNSSLTEYFGAINGQVRYNQQNGQTTTVTVSGCTMTFNQGGLTAKSGC